MPSPPNRVAPRPEHTRQGMHWRASQNQRREPIDRLGWALVALVGGGLVLILVVTLLVREFG